MAEDIVDALEAEGSPLSLRAARYIRIKRQTEAGLESQLRSMCQKSLAHPDPTGKTREPPHCPTCDCSCEPQPEEHAK